MSRDGGLAPNPPPSRHAFAHVTLRSCREGLRAAVRLLSLIDPKRSGASGSTGEPEASLLRNFQAAEQAYDDLLTNISHEVKTSLTVIRGHAQMMARSIRRGDAIDREALLATLKRIDTSALRISNELDGRIDGDRSDSGQSG